MKLHWTYLVYIIFWETLTIGGSAYVVFGLGESGWWFLLGVILSGAALRPNKWKDLLTEEKSPHQKPDMD